MINSSVSKEYLFLVCQKVVQPIGTFYITSIPWYTLKKIAYTEPRILLGRNDDGTEEYVGIQRLLSNTRKEDIWKYLQSSSATFPSNIIINIPKEELKIENFNLNTVLNLGDDSINENPELKNLDNLDIKIKQDFVLIIIRNRTGVAQIIDGQHRLSGFEKYREGEIEFDLPVTIFFDQSIYQQAEIFATINGKQTRVTPSLVYDLFGISDKRNPYTVARYIVKSLNENEDSPLKESIKILGKANEYYSGFVTQSTVSQIIIDLICGNLKQAEEDRKRMQIGREISDEPELTRKKALLRKYFKDEKDEVIFKVLLNFFNAVKETFPVEWNKVDSILKKTVGFTALLKILPKVVEQGKEAGDWSEEFFKKKLVPSKEIDFSEIQLSSKGVNQLVQRFNID